VDSETSLNLTIADPGSGAGGGDAQAQAPLFSIIELDDTRLRYSASFPGSADGFDLTFTRRFGVVSGSDEECKVANLPFAYDSLVHGHITLHGRTFTFNHEPRFRAYVESTWGCELPKPGGADADPRDFPVSLGTAWPLPELRSGSPRRAVGAVWAERCLRMCAYELLCSWPLLLHACTVVLCCPPAAF
jgi:hypothetical protein